MVHSFCPGFPGLSKLCPGFLGLCKVSRLDVCGSFGGNALESPTIDSLPCSYRFIQFWLCTYLCCTIGDCRYKILQMVAFYPMAQRPVMVDWPVYFSQNVDYNQFSGNNYFGLARDCKEGIMYLSRLASHWPENFTYDKRRIVT